MVPRLQTAAVLLLLASLIARGDKRQLNKRQLRIIDGDDTYNYPYVVAIVDKIELTFYLRKCTGSLISDMWVLTAANCGIVDNEEYFGVVYGNLSIPPHRSPNYRAVLYAVNNPRYRSDICLAMIDRLDLAPGKVSAVDHKTLIGRAMHFVGVGLNSSNKTLLKLKNKGVRNAVLKDNVRPMQFGEGIVVQCDRRLEKGFKTALICLKPRCVNKGLRVQHGDYGGPLIFKGKIVGIATNLNKDTLYTAVSPHLDWIQSVTESMRGLIFRSPHDNERLEIYKSHRDPKHGAELGTFFRNKINTRPVFRAEESVPDPGNDIKESDYLEPSSEIEEYSPELSSQSEEVEEVPLKRRTDTKDTLSSFENMRICCRNRIERTASKRWRGSVRRVFSATVYNLSCFTHGCSTGWVSGVLGNEALTGGAWLAALPCLVALPAAPFFAVLADARGRKAGALCVCVSFIISWSLAAWCGPRGVWAARVAAGAGGAGSLALAPLYCAEIAPRTRGLAAMPALACSCGILFAYGAGGVLSAHALSLSMAVPPVVLLVSLLWLPETPSFLISVGRIQDAAKVMCWFDGSDFQEDLTDVIEQQEVRIRTSECYGRRDMRRQDSDTFQPMLKRISGLDSNSDKKTEQSPCRELFRHRRSRRALFSCLVLLCAAAGSGAGAVNSFAAAVLRHSAHAVPHLNVTAYNFTIYNGTAPRAFFDTSEAGSMLCGTALVLGAAVATVTVDKIGRKMLLLWSCSGIACCLAILGVYCDPRLRMHSWYSQRLWPYKRTTMKDESISENLSLTYQDNINDAAMNNLTDGILKLNFPDEEVGSNNLNEGFVLPIPRLSDNNDTLTERDVMMTKYEDESEVTIWAPVVLLSMMLFLYNIGLGSVPYVLITEMFSINVRSLASGLFISWMWLSNFLLLRYYGTIAISLGLHGTYYISASITLLGAVYTYFVIPETKGRSQGQIEEALSRPLCGRKRRKNEETR